MVVNPRARLAAGAAAATLLSPAPPARKCCGRYQGGGHADRRTVKAGGTVTVRLSVRLPQDVHVQSDKPRDPSLIPTALTLVPPAGFSVDKITYPKAIDLSQSDGPSPSRCSAASSSSRRGSPRSRGSRPVNTSAGDLRYQACNESVCFAPARATAQWTITVSGAN
jgi:hypothetical protein